MSGHPVVVSAKKPTCAPLEVSPNPVGCAAAYGCVSTVLANWRICRAVRNWLVFVVLPVTASPTMVVDEMVVGVVGVPVIKPVSVSYQ